MIAGVADTHAAIWFLYGDRRLSVDLQAAFNNRDAPGVLSCGSGQA